jgi:hypothetical protein
MQRAGKQQAGVWLGSQNISAPRSGFEIDIMPASGRAVSIQIPVDVIERIDRAIALGLKMRVPCDVSGFLIGRIVKEKGQTIVVDGYETVRYSVESGDSSFANDERLQARVQEWKQQKGPECVVGFFRSQRAVRPAIDREDLKGAKRMLPRGRNIFLLIETGADGAHTGIVFLRKGRRAKVEKEFREFSFRADIVEVGSNDLAPNPGILDPAAAAASFQQSRVQGIGITESAEHSAENVAPERIAETAGSPPESDARNEPGQAEAARTEAEDLARHEVGAWFTRNPQPRVPLWRPWLSIISTWTIAVGVTMWCINGKSLSEDRPAEVRETRPVIVSNPLGLQVDAGQGLLNIVWDRTSAAAMNSKGGYITIRDGELVKQVPLDNATIRTGHLYYSPRSTDLGFRLEVAAEDGATASESVRVIGPPDLPVHARAANRLLRSQRSALGATSQAVRPTPFSFR